MGLLDKLKDLFVDEVVEDDELELEEEEKEEYKKPKDTLPKVMRDTIAVNEKKEKETPTRLKLEDLELTREEPKKAPVTREPKKELPKEEKVVKETKEVKETKKFSFPIELDDDYPPRRTSNINVLELEKEKTKEKVEQKHELYPPKEEPVQKSKFKASPVISPVYGILDKNYKKDEVIEKEEDDSSIKRPSKTVDFETVRKKAFGNLSDEIKDNLMCENCELYKEAKRLSSLQEDDLLYDMTVEENEPVTIEKAYDNYEEFGVAYEPTTKKKEKVKEEDIVINNNTEKLEPDKIEIKEEPKKVELPSRELKNKKEEVLDDEEEVKEEIELKKDKVDDDFFDLIDSMYKERNDE